MERFLEGSFWDDTPEERAEFGLSTDTNNPDQMFIEWLQSKFPEGKPIVYQGNQYYGTGGGDVESSSTVTEGKPVTLESTNASQNAEGKSTSKTEESSTLAKTETDVESSDGASEAEESYEWVTHLNDDDTKDKVDTKTNDTSKKDASQYPNGMSQEEFNAMYEYALGMSGKGENTENGIWGSFETLPLKIPELTRELEKYEKAGNETKANAAREQLENAKEQLSSLESFITNYKDVYSPIKEKTKSEYKKDMDAAGEAALRSYADLFAATDQVETIQDGFDHTNNKFTPGQNEYTDSYGNEYTTDISVFGDKVSITTSVYSADGEYGRSFIQTTNDYKGLEEALSKADENEKNIETKYNDLVKKYNDAKASFEGAKEVTKQDIMDAYAAGKLNPYQAAVALTKADDHTISFNYDDIISNVDYDKFSGVAGSRGDGTVGINSFMSDITGPDITAGEKEASSTSISKKITEEFVSLNDMKDRLNEIDVSNIKSKEQAETLSNDLSNYLSDLSVKANNELQTLVTSLLETGGKLQNVRNDPKFKSLSTEIYTLAQAVYDKTSAIEEYTGKYFGDIDISSRRAIKKNIEEVSNKIAEMQGAEHIVHTDDKGRTSFILNKEEVKALANYGKTIDATKDAAIALMKSAAFNGAENVTGDKYSETWKREFADTELHNEDAGFKDNMQDIASGLIGTKDSGKITFGDFLAAGAKGMLGVVTMGLGIAAIPYNPVLGTMLTFAGVNSVGREVLKYGTKLARANSTNEEAMFGQNYDKGRKVWNEIYNRSFEKANYGDPKSVATWTAAVGVLGGLVEMMTGGIGFADGIVRIQQNVEILKSNGLAGNVDTTIKNVYELGENIITWSKMNININDYMKDPNDPNLIAKGRNVNVLTDDDISIKPNYATYGEATSDDSSVLDNKYSGYAEQAKNSNLAKDYNAGMEQETNEAVSDKYVKVFKVMLDKEPDYIRKVLIAIPKKSF